MFRYHNVGGKIKGLARLISFLTFLPFLLFTLALWIFTLVNTFYVDGGTIFGLFLISIIILAIGYFVAWIAGLMMFGFGELIEKTCETKNAVSDLHKMLFIKMKE